MRINLLEIIRASKPQTEMASMFEVSQQTWSSWETGRTVPDHETMLKMELRFHIPMEVIFFDSFNYKMKLNNYNENGSVVLPKTG